MSDDTLWRAETGAIRFGEDWSGVYIRGDEALNYVHMLLNVLGTKELEVSPHHRRLLGELCVALHACSNPAQATRLKPIDRAVEDVEVEKARREGEYQRRKSKSEEVGSAFEQLQAEHRRVLDLRAQRAVSLREVDPTEES
jgi:tryptophan 2,3-dioxygenase